MGNIRCTQKGELMLVPSKPNKQTVDSFRGQVRRVSRSESSKTRDICITLKGQFNPSEIEKSAIKRTYECAQTILCY